MNKFKDILINNMYYIIFLIVLAVALQTILAPSLVNGISMEPTLSNNDLLLINRLKRNHSRGDIVTVNISDSNSRINTIFNRNSNIIYVKRILAIEGDKIEFKNGSIYINDEFLYEDYILENSNEPNRVLEVPEGKVFVIGDNRANSTDSRQLGFFEESAIDGSVYLRIFPFSKIKRIN